MKALASALSLGSLFAGVLYAQSDVAMAVGCGAVSLLLVVAVCFQPSIRKAA